MGVAVLGPLMAAGLPLGPDGSARAEETQLPRVNVFNAPVPRPLDAQGQPIVALPVGGSVLYLVTRDTGAGAVTVMLQTENPAAADGEEQNPTRATHSVHFPEGVTSRVVYTDVEAGRPGDYGSMQATILPGTGYTVVKGGTASIPVRDPIARDVFVHIQPPGESVAEGEDAVFTLQRRGSTASELQVRVDVRDPDLAMQGNHWDEPVPGGERTVTIPAGETRATLTVPTRQNIRDTGELTITARILPSRQQEYQYWVGTDYEADAAVADDDSAPLFLIGVAHLDLVEGESQRVHLRRLIRSQEQRSVVRMRVEHNREWTDPENPDGVSFYTFDTFDAAGNSQTHLVPAPDNLLDEEDSWTTRIFFDVHPDVPENKEHEYVKGIGNLNSYWRVRDAYGAEPRVSITAGQEVLQAGEMATFIVSRAGDLTGELAVTIQTTEPNHPRATHDSNPTTRNHDVTLAAGSRTAELAVMPDAAGTPGGDILQVLSAEVVAKTGYVVGAEPSASVSVIAATSDNAFVTIAADDSDIDEGDTASFTLRRTGDTAAALTVAIEVRDPRHALRGNHWDPEPTLPTSVTFEAGSATASLELATKDDVRDIQGDSRLYVTLTGGDDEHGEGGYGYYRGYPFAATVEVADDDVAPEISLSVTPEQVVEGDSVTFTVTRHGPSDAWDSAPFVLRIGPDYTRRVARLRNEISTVDYGYIYEEPQDYPVTIAADEDAAEFTLEVRFDPDDDDFRFEAEILDNAVLGIDESNRSQYFRIRDGAGTAAAEVTNRERQRVEIHSVAGQVIPRGSSFYFFDDTRFSEGQEIPFVLARSGPDSLLAKAVTVSMRYIEPSHPGNAPRPSFYNPTRTTLFVTFAAGETLAQGSFTTFVDDADEPGGSDAPTWLFYFAESWESSWYAPYINSNARHVAAFMRDNLRAVSIASDSAGVPIEEGETASFHPHAPGPQGRGTHRHRRHRRPRALPPRQPLASGPGPHRLRHLRGGQ